MERTLILFGNSSFARLMKWYIENDDSRKIAAVTVDKNYIENNEFEGLPVIPFEELEKMYQPDEIEILIAVGYSKMNDVRKKVFQSCREKGFQVASYIHSSAKISGNVQMGEGNIILEDTLIQPFAVIGDGNLIWQKVSIAHDCMVGNFNTICAMTSICGRVNLKNNCFIGSNATIQDHITIEDYTLAGAGVYVNSDTLKYGVYVPAKGNVIKMNKERQDILI
jgi:sugar O-acyltransferase (sialic acid O-acetyltransferase NeuD family)